MNESALPRSVELKVDAVLVAMHAGMRLVDTIAEATGLPQTTVLRVAALLHDLGLIDMRHDSGKLELLLSLPE